MMWLDVDMQANELELALDVYGQLIQDGCTPNLVTYNILIDVHGKTGQWQEAVKVLDALDLQVHSRSLDCDPTPQSRVQIPPGPVIVHVVFLFGSEFNFNQSQSGYERCIKFVLFKW
jgi:pentatricopeptide repeat protein